MAATWGSSALSTAVPSGGRASTSSPLALAIASREPNMPRWDSPTLRTTPTAGRARRARAAMWPGPRAPISTTTAWVPGSIRARVRGRPTSLLNDAWLATVSRRVARTAASRSLVVVLPLDPVTATTVAAERSRTAVPRAARAARGSATSTRGPAKTVPSWARVAAAPARAAAAANRLPSVRLPGRATNRSPAPDLAGVDLDPGDDRVRVGPGQPPAGRLGDLLQA